MQTLVRLLPFIARQRMALIASVGLSIAAAFFAVGQLSLIYPVMKLLMEGKNWHQHVAAHLETARATAAEQAKLLAVIDSWLNDGTWRSEHNDTELKRLRTDRGQAVSDLNRANRGLFLYGCAEAWLLPIVPEDRFNFLAWLLGVLLLMALLKEVSSYFQELIVGSVVQRILQSMREQLFRSTLKLDHQTLLLETTPRLMSRFTFDLMLVAQGLSLLGNKVIVEPLKAGICIGCAFAANWRLTSLAFICAPLLALLLRGMSKRLKRAAQRQMESMSRIYQVLEETFVSLRTVQAYRNERFHRLRLAREQSNYYEKTMKIVRIDALISPSVEFLAMCAIFVASLPGAYLVLRHKTAIWGVQLASEPMTVSDLALLYTCMAGVLDPGRKLSSVYSKLKKAATACGRVFDWMDRASLAKNSPQSTPVPRHHQSIEFDDVRYRYAQTETGELGPPVLDGVSITIPFGATVAVVGGNGSGKSTLAHMLPRLFDPQTGHVRIDGADLSSMDVRQLRRQIGIVTQETLLFDWSIAENIRYGKPDATDAEIESAARMAHVVEFVSQLPDGFATTIGDKGQRLSGGQRQRVALARAILRDPAILILDEATSAIDSHSEQCIHRSLRAFAHDRTTLIVTHALVPSLLECITHVLVMDQGRVISFGPHDVVLRTCPLYQKLFEAQTLKRTG